MANISFKRGSNLSNLPIVDGQFIVNTDERSIYVDVGTERLRMGDFISVASVDALPAAGANATALYYVEDINVLCRWSGSQWTQINKDQGMTSVSVTGSGNSITSASYDEKTRTLTLVKGETFITPVAVDGKISDKVGTLKIGDTTYDTVVAYVNKKAEDTLSAAQGGSSETAASVKQALDNYKTENDAKVQANADAIDVIEADYLKAADKEALQADIDTKAAQTDLTALSNKVGTVADGKTVVSMIGDVETAYQAKDTELAASIKTISDDYLTSTDKTELQGNIDKKVDQTAYNAKVSALETADTTLQTNIDNEAKARKDADDAQVARIDTLEGQITGLSGAMHFEGVKTEVPTDVTSYEAGDVIIVGEKEYVFNGTAFVEFGDVSAEGERIAALETTVGDDTSGLVKSVADNATAIATEKSRAEGAEAANKAAAEAAQAAAEAAQDDVDAIASDYLKSSDKTALEGSISAVSGRVTAIENKNISNGANKVEASTTNGNIKIDGVETVVYTHPAEHAISEVTGLQDALDAKATVTALNATNANVTANANAITGLDTSKADKATTLAGYGITDAYMKSETYTQAEVDAKLTWGDF